jgi:hypothetical protein
MIPILRHERIPRPKSPSRGVRAPGKLVQGGCHVETAETLRRDPAGERPARQRLATRREPSVAWFRGDPSCEAYTGSEQAA